MFWCQEAEHEIATTESASKAAAVSYDRITNKLAEAGLGGDAQSSLFPSSTFQNGFSDDNGNCIDLIQTKQRQLDLSRLTDELNLKWKPSSSRAVAEAEAMIDRNNYASVDVR